MPLEDFFGDMFPKDEMTETKILHDLLDSTKNLNMKTRISDPLSISLFDVAGLRFKHKKMKKCYELISNFSKYYKEHMVSFPDGEGRKEITSALSAIREQKSGLSFTERMLGMREK